MVSDDELRRKAEKIAEAKRSVYIHIPIYLFVNILLYVIWWINSGIGTFPWPVIVTIGWGIGVIAHIFVAFGKGIDNSKMVEKEYQKLKEKNK